MEQLLDATTPKALFINSLDRCSQTEEFVSTFYKRFISSSDEVRRKFQFTSFDKQNEMLLRSLKLSAGASSGDKESLRELTERARTHDHHHLNIKPELYDLWLDVLITTAKEYDSDWDESIENAWRKILGFVISRMVAKY